MNEKEITATFQVAIPTINHHITLAESSVGSRRSALAYVHFEIENDRVHIVSTNGSVLLHTEVSLDDGLAKEPIAFDVRAMPKINAKKSDTTPNKSLALFSIKDGLISSGVIVARIAVDVGFPKWREALPDRARLERETAWRRLDPKYYALAQKFTGDDYADPHCVKGLTHGPVVFYNTPAKGNELNTAVVAPLYEAQM